MRSKNTDVAAKELLSTTSADIASVPEQRPTIHAADSWAAGRPNLKRHTAKCGICAHERRDEIEAAYIAWKSPATIAREYGLRDRSAVSRHAEALNLKDRRRRNVRVALELIIEHAGDLRPNASAVVAAVQTYAKINERGEWIERDERLYPRDLFGRMTPQELETYAKENVLPAWFLDAISAAGGRLPAGGNK
jgi:hypothetical protein